MLFRFLGHAKRIFRSIQSSFINETGCWPGRVLIAYRGRGIFVFIRQIITALEG